MRISFLILFLFFFSKEKLLSQVWHLKIGDTVPTGHGIVIMEPSSKKTEIPIRCGINALNNIEPLLIVDGTPFDFKKLQNINPNNIESIDIIKDSLAITLFGNRAKSGVILIKTKNDIPKVIHKVLCYRGKINSINTWSKKDSIQKGNMNIFLNNTSFKVFPNPVQSGTSLNIECKESDEGEYTLQLFNQAGQLAFNKAIWIDKDARVLNLEVPHVAAGNYFLRMTNKNSGKAFTEKIIIQ